VLTGSGRAFCAGGDLEIMTSGMSRDLEGAMRHQEAAVLLREMPKPTIAAVNGPAAGAGLSLAAAADFRIAAKSARFAPGFGAVGLCGDFGGTYSLLSLVGREQALRLYVAGETWDADTALNRGLVGEVVPDVDFPAAGEGLASRLAATAPLAVARLKANFLAAERQDFETILRLEGAGMIELMASGDFSEGVAAFQERRRPQFRGGPT
jgi:2-(1,2-epoxy-1,2-dihydrophenyl)acetyl-CoA isomerase